MSLCVNTYLEPDPKEFLFHNNVVYCCLFLFSDNISPRALEGKSHNFVMHTFDKPTRCSCCKGLLNGTFYQGYRCTGEDVKWDLILVIRPFMCLFCLQLLEYNVINHVFRMHWSHFLLTAEVLIPEALLTAKALSTREAHHPLFQGVGFKFNAIYRLVLKVRFIFLGSSRSSGGGGPPPIPSRESVGHEKFYSIFEALIITESFFSAFLK